MITLKDFFSFKNNRFFWLNLIAMPIAVIAIIIGVLYWLDAYTLHGESILVPNTNGLPLQQARQEFDKRELKIAVVDSDYVKGMPAGAILDQKPAAGAKVKKGRTVYLTINTDEVPKVAIPDIIDNSSFRQAEARLRALGFKMTAPEFIEGEKDWVYGVKCNGKELSVGAKVPRESVLTLRVGDDKLSTDSLRTDSLSRQLPKDDTPIVDDSWF